MAKAKPAAFPDIVRALTEDQVGMHFELLRRNSKQEIIKYPVWVKLLRRDEEMFAIEEAQTMAREEFKEVPKEYGDIYKEAQAVTLIRRVLCRPDLKQLGDGTEVHMPVFVTSQQLRQSFTSAEIAQCLNMYEIVKATFSSIRDLDDKTIDSWAHELSQPSGAFFLSLLDSDQWPRLILELAQAYRSSREKLGQPLQSSPDTTESDPEISTPDTGDFTTLPDAHPADLPEEKLPTDRLLTSSEAQLRAKAIREAARKSEGGDDE